MIIYVYWISVLAMFIIGILIAVKMFQASMIWQGILTIICSIFGLIYGWMKKDELQIGGLMIPYTICFVVALVTKVIIRANARAAMGM
jgi:hypothetical protein